jgi:hypothetical protein
VQVCSFFLVSCTGYGTTILGTRLLKALPPDGPFMGRRLFIAVSAMSGFLSFTVSVEGGSAVCACFFFDGIMLENKPRTDEISGISFEELEP